MRLIILLACLLVGVEVAACPPCADTTICEAHICSKFNAGIIATAQGRIMITCPCRNTVLITVIDENGEVRINNREMNSGQRLFLYSLGAGMYVVQARHKGNQVIEQIAIVEVP